MSDSENNKLVPAILFGIALAAFFALGYLMGSAGSLDTNLKNKDILTLEDELPPSEIGTKAVNYMYDHTEGVNSIQLLNVSDSDLDGFYQIWLRLGNASDNTTEYRKRKIYASKDGGYLIGQPVNSSEEIKSLLPLNSLETTLAAIREEKQ